MSISRKNTSYTAKLCPPSPAVFWWIQLTSGQSSVPTNCTQHKRTHGVIQQYIIMSIPTNTSWYAELSPPPSVPVHCNHCKKGKWSDTATSHVPPSKYLLICWAESSLLSSRWVAISVRRPTFCSSTLHPEDKQSYTATYHQWHVHFKKKYLLYCKAVSSLSCSFLVNSTDIWSIFCSNKLHPTQEDTWGDTATHHHVYPNKHLLICWAESSLFCSPWTVISVAWSTFCSIRLHAPNTSKKAYIHTYMQCDPAAHNVHHNKHLLMVWAESSLSCSRWAVISVRWSTFCSNPLHPTWEGHIEWSSKHIIMPISPTSTF